MFEFDNNVYSGVLTILSCLFGIAYPQIVNCIERIDDKYSSTSLTSRFREEFAFKSFNLFLVIDLIISVFTPFVINLYCNVTITYFILTVQVLFTIFLVCSSFYLYNVILTYYDIKQLQRSIWKDFLKDKKNANEDYAKKHFTEWIDLSSKAITSPDQEVVKLVCDNWTEYLFLFNSMHKDVSCPYDEYAYTGIYRIICELCKSKNVPYSINDENYLLTSLFTTGDKLVAKMYNLIWRSLLLQIQYQKDDWVINYWKSASQYFRFNLRPLTERDRNSDNHSYSRSDIKNRLNRREEFAHFHIMLMALILQQGNLKLLKRIFFYTESQPAIYPLVPSTMAECLRFFAMLNSGGIIGQSGLEYSFPMPGFDGLSYRNILEESNSLIVLLVYRLYVLPSYFYGIEWSFEMPSVPSSFREIMSLKKTLSLLKLYLPEDKMDKTVLTEVLGITSINKEIMRLNKFANGKIKSPICYIDDFITILNSEMDRLKVECNYDSDVVSRYENIIRDSLKKGISIYSDFRKKIFLADYSNYYLNCYVSHLYPNEAFTKEPSVYYANIDDSISDDILGQFYHAFSSAFYMYSIEGSSSRSRSWAIDSDSLFDAIRKISLNKDKLTVSANRYHCSA